MSDRECRPPALAQYLFAIDFVQETAGNSVRLSSSKPTGISVEGGSGRSSFVSPQPFVSGPSNRQRRERTCYLSPVIRDLAAAFFLPLSSQALQPLPCPRLRANVPPIRRSRMRARPSISSRSA